MHTKEIKLTDLIRELAEQADFWGMESLTENQQALLNGYITQQQYHKLESEETWAVED